MAEKRYLAYASFMLAAIFGYLETFHVELTNDTHYYMHCALQLWKHGPAQFYNFCFDENFPYHTVLYTPFAVFAASYHIAPDIVLHTACCTCCVISLVVLSRTMKAQNIGEEDRYLWLAISAFALLDVPSIYGVFADREHLLFVFALPWMVQMLLRMQPLKYTCIMAAFGFLMKPHDYALFGIMTLTAGPAAWSLRQRLFSFSSVVICAAMGIYLLLIWIFIPDFFRVILPLSLVVYPTLYYSSDYKFNFAQKYIVLAAAISLTFARPWVMTRPWLGFIAGCTIVMLLNAGWDYTFYVAAMPMVLAFILPWLSHYGGATETQQKMKKIVRWLALGMLVICLYSIGSEMGVLPPTHFRNHNTVDPALRAIMQQDAGDKIIVLSPYVWNSQVEPFAGKPEAVFGYDNLWTYRWLGPHANDSHAPEIRSLLTSNFLRTLQQNPTAVIFADITPNAIITPDGPLGFLMRDPEVREAMKPYVIVKDINLCAPRGYASCRFVELKRPDVKTP